MQTTTSLIASVRRIAAFSDGARGGNPAGVHVAEVLPDAMTMQQMAAEIDYSETVFAAPAYGGWRVRYFAPEAEVPFCGHATISLGAVLAEQEGDGVFALTTNHANITVEGRRQGGLYSAALQSPRTRSAPLEAAVRDEALALFGYTPADLDSRLPPAYAEAGAAHLILPLNSRERLAAMRYDLAAGRAFMKRTGVVTIAWVHAESATLLHARNAFAAGGVYEDPATGAAAAALAGHLRDSGWLRAGAIEILQGFDMGVPARLRAEYGPEPGSSVRVAGTAHALARQPALID
ncbi:PhzF family phenazine biosynthesis protein [Bordetella pertussis]|uniref:PhzF family phenazine biosynthesis protein n=1 Tax=Bordetella pertussis TaxID=520 RepID=UPI00097D1A94|nr:PhzF family phenazine biosynthesis protein [Bordetella pertussis]AQI16838.1 PhzF family phenazine biosynthesis protein [Bordetella pertussis]